jgi:hypothetical protein
MRRHAGPRRGVLEGRDAALLEPPHPLGDRAHTHGKSFPPVAYVQPIGTVVSHTILFRALRMNNVFSKDS